VSPPANCTGVEGLGFDTLLKLAARSTAAQVFSQASRMTGPMNSNGFFDWIRQGVKQSVLLGVSDALETLGTVDADQTYHPSIAKALGASQGAAEVLPGPNRTPRKRLGKSLKDLNPEGVVKPKTSQGPMP
jgi:hypothetical protein